MDTLEGLGSLQANLEDRFDMEAEITSRLEKIRDRLLQLRDSL